MEGTANVLLYTTIGEVIKRSRVQANLTITQLGNLTGIHKGVISKIENGDTKRPEMKTIKAISKVLDIPFEEMIEHYIEVEQRTEALRELLLEALAFSNRWLLSKVALKFLESPHEESDAALDSLFHLTETAAKTEIKILLYDLIIKYARQRGMQRYLAKGLLQKYLIERMDLKRMDESFRNGEEILHYVDFLSVPERLTLYYRLALQAFAIKKYDKCIELAQAGLREDRTANEMKERAALAICNSYILLEQFESAEKHLTHFESLHYKFIVERAKAIRATISFGKQDYYSAIPLLRECLNEATDDTRIHIVNDLLESLLNIHDMESLQEVFRLEEKKLIFEVATPHKHREVGRYFKLKGDWLLKTEMPDTGIACYLQSILSYEQVRAFEEIAQCVGAIFTYHVTHQAPLKIELLEKLEKCYNRMNHPKERMKEGER